MFTFSIYFVALHVTDAQSGQSEWRDAGIHGTAYDSSINKGPEAFRSEPASGRRPDSLLRRSPMGRMAFVGTFIFVFQAS